MTYPDLYTEEEGATDNENKYNKKCYDIFVLFRDCRQLFYQKPSSDQRTIEKLFCGASSRCIGVVGFLIFHAVFYVDFSFRFEPILHQVIPHTTLPISKNHYLQTLFNMHTFRRFFFSGRMFRTFMG